MWHWNHQIWASIEEDIAFGRELFCTGQTAYFMLYAFCFLLYAFVLTLLFGFPLSLWPFEWLVNPIRSDCKASYKAHKFQICDQLFGYMKTKRLFSLKKFLVALS